MAWSRRSIFVLFSVVFAAAVLRMNMKMLRPLSGRPSSVSIARSNPDEFLSYGVSCDRVLALQDSINGVVLCPNQGGFSEAITIFNDRHANKHLPSVVVQPLDVQGVSDALKIATDLGIQVTVKNGGHNPAGLARHGGGMLMDMSKMKSIELKKDRMEMVVESGVLWIEAQEVIRDANITFVGGGCPSVGVVGLFLGGGIGWISRSKGLASDNVIDMELVLANGTIATVSEGNHPELFWGLRGAGGSNFGVVTRARFAVFRSEPRYFAGQVCFAVTDTGVLKKLMAAWMEGVEELEHDGPSAWMVVSRLADLGSKRKRKFGFRFCIPLFHDGPEEEGATAAAPLLNKLGAIVEKHPEVTCRHPNNAHCQSGIRRLTEGQAAREWLVSGRPFMQNHTFISWSQSMGIENVHIDWRSGFLEEVKSGFVDNAIEQLVHLPSFKGTKDIGAATFQFQVEHLGGKISEFRERGAYSHRGAHLLWSIQVFIQVAKMMPGASTSNTVERWATQSFEKFEPYFKGSYANYADPLLENKDWQHRYYGENYERLQRLKESVGGFHIFNTRQRIEKPAT
ncbi:hypothetical protein BSKO_10711 [Bryopsis sp. KO-2023]|nr:hypothetical protein BSKO_10711 [Bryopsis sp. KO-2023]